MRDRIDPAWLAALQARERGVARRRPSNRGRAGDRDRRRTLAARVRGLRAAWGVARVRAADARTRPARPDSARLRRLRDGPAARPARSAGARGTPRRATPRRWPSTARASATSSPTSTPAPTSSAATDPAPRRSRRERPARRSGRPGSASSTTSSRSTRSAAPTSGSPSSRRPSASSSFAIGHAAFVAQYRFALELLDRLDRNPDLQPPLNEPVPELGLPKGTYARVRLRFLNVARSTEFAALGMVDEDTKAAAPPALAAAIAEDRAAIWRYGAGRGQVMTVTNALQVVQRAAFAGWFPVQAGIAEWMGDTRLVPRDRALGLARADRRARGRAGARRHPPRPARGVPLQHRDPGVLAPRRPLRRDARGAPARLRRSRGRRRGSRPAARRTATSRRSSPGPTRPPTRGPSRRTAARPGGRSRRSARASRSRRSSTRPAPTTWRRCARGSRPSRRPPRSSAPSATPAAPTTSTSTSGPTPPSSAPSSSTRPTSPAPGRQGLRLPLVEVLGRPVLPPSEIVAALRRRARHARRHSSTSCGSSTGGRRPAWRSRATSRRSAGAGGGPSGRRSTRRAALRTRDAALGGHHGCAAPHYAWRTGRERTHRELPQPIRDECT